MHPPSRPGVPPEPAARSPRSAGRGRWRLTPGRAPRRAALLVAAAVMAAGCGGGGEAPAGPNEPEPSATRLLTITVAGTGSGTVTGAPAGACSAGTCGAPVPTGTRLTLSATPAAGSTFASWTGACEGGGTCAVTMTDERAVTATFAAAPVAQPIVTVAAGDTSATEVYTVPAGADPGTFTVSRTGATAAALAVNLVVGGTATNGIDYAPIASSVVIPAGRTSAAVYVVARVDALVEGPETVTLTAAAGKYAVGTPAAAAVTIVDAGGGAPVFALGATYSGSIRRAGQVDTFTVAADANDRIFVSVGEAAPLSSAFYPSLRVVDPQGIVSSSGYSDLAVELEDGGAAGTYRILVADEFGRASGSYRLSVIKVPGPISAAAGDDGTVVGPGVVYPGSIFEGDLDVWTFRAVQGARVVVTALDGSERDLFFSPNIRLVAATGEVLGRDSDGQAAEISLTVPRTGTYYVIVGNGGTINGAAGTYRLTVAGALPP